MAKQDDYVRYTIRVPAELYERLQKSAGEKSVNAEIINRLDESFHLPLVVEHLQKELTIAEDERDGAIEGAAEAWEKVEAEIARASLLTHRRIPEGLFGRIKVVAEANNRPVDEEIVQALEVAYPIPKLTFGEYMKNLRDWLAATQGKSEYTVRPIFEALLQAYEACAKSHPGWTAKRPKIDVSPGAFPMNFEPAEDDAA